MSGHWQDSDRRAELPANWPELRAAVFRRDGYRCTARDRRNQRCPEVATDCDHVIPGNDHAMTNLTSLCADHHAHKSALEGVAAREAKRTARRRPAEKHPNAL